VVLNRAFNGALKGALNEPAASTVLFCILHFPFGVSVSIFACPSVVCSQCISTIINFAIVSYADTLQFKSLQRMFLILYWLEIYININYIAPFF
jgi:hypothetical protein